MAQRRAKPVQTIDRPKPPLKTWHDTELERQLWDGIERLRKRRAEMSMVEEMAFLTDLMSELRQKQVDQQAAWERGWETIDRTRERNADKDPDEELAFITEIVEEVRQEHYEREQREAQGRR